MESRVALLDWQQIFPQQYHMNHTEMTQEENGNADMCGYMHSIESALRNHDWLFP